MDREELAIVLVSTDGGRDRSTIGEELARGRRMKPWDAKK